MTGRTLTRTPFDAAQRAIPGAEFAEWEGWDWIAGFGDSVAEHHAVRRACGIWDESPLQKWDVEGPGAMLAVDRFFTNDMRSLQVGQLRYGAFCDDDGRMLGDGIAFRLADDRLRLVTALETDGDAFAQAAGDAEHQLERVTDRWPHLQVQGPDSRDVIQSLTTADVSSIGYYRFLPAAAEVGGVDAMLARCGYSGELGYELYCAPNDAERLWAALMSTGRVRPYGLNAVETLRQEAGLIFLGYDYFPGRTDPFEMNLDRVVRLDKPGFRGQAALREIAGRPTRRLTTLLVDGDEVPAYGAAVFQDGAVVGEVRSPSASPTMGRVIGMSVIDAERIHRGARFQVEMPGGGTAAATSDSYPLYDPDKLRPRA
jgi:aminomethyltransferase